MGGEVGDLGDGGRDGGEGFIIHSENTTHIDSNRLGAKKQGSGDQRQAARESAKKGEKQGRTRRDGSAKRMGTGHYKHNRERSNKVTYSNRLDGSSLFSQNDNSCKNTIHPTYNKHNAGSSTPTSKKCWGVEPSKPRRGV